MSSHSSKARQWSVSWLTATAEEQKLGPADRFELIVGPVVFWHRAHEMTRAFENFMTTASFIVLTAIDAATGINQDISPVSRLST